jgi:hypothetical protein
MVNNLNLSDGSYYVYAYYDPTRENKIFYVGKGKGRRCFQHLTDKPEYCANKRLNGRIRHLLSIGVKPTIKLLASGLTEEQAYNVEEINISKYGRKGLDVDGILLNILKTGRPPTLKGSDHPNYGKPMSDHTKNKLSESLKEVYRRDITKHGRCGKKHTDETKRLISESKKGHTQSEESRMKRAAARKGYKHSQETKDRIRDSNSYVWEVTDPDNNKEVTNNLKEYCKNHNLTVGNMYSVASGALKHHKGYKIKRV